MKNNRKTMIVQFIIIVLFICSFFYLDLPLKKEKVTLTKCVDGDTAHFLIDGQDQSVRFLAIDAPEIDSEIGQEVSDYVCALLTNATLIELEYDDLATVDKYNRVLAWVFVDHQLLEEDLIEKGYAEVKYIYDDYKYVELLEKRQEESRKKQIGIWK